jgi:formamidopyrimidine-DNA glycosylase
MPELPEVEVLVRHLAPLVAGRRISDVTVRRPKVLLPTSVPEFETHLRGATIQQLARRAKYLVFTLRKGRSPATTLVGHLGMTGRMYVLLRRAPLPKHAAVILGFGREQFVFEDMRYFGRFTLDTGALEGLGPEPLSEEFTVERFASALKRSGQAIKVRLLDQRLVAGVGNIYASEALHRAGISPRTPSRKLTRDQVARLWRAIRETLTEAIEWGSTLTLKRLGNDARGLFYFADTGGGSSEYERRLRVYDRGGEACRRCGGSIRRMVQAARSTFYCPGCQKR